MCLKGRTKNGTDGQNEAARGGGGLRLLNHNAPEASFGAIIGHAEQK